MRLSNVLINSYQTCPNKTAVKYLNTSLTYAGLYHNVCRTANALIRAGVKPGDPVGIVCRNGIEYLEAMFGIAFMGAVPALINWRLAPVAVSGMLSLVGAKVVFISNTEQKTLSWFRENHSESFRLIVTPHDPALPSNYEDFRAGAADEYSAVQPEDEDIALIMFTSGTSGLSKAVALSNRAICSQIRRLAASGLWKPEDVFLCMSPLCHAISLSVMALLYAGGKLILCPPEFIRDCDKVLEIIEREQVTSTALVPTVVNRLVTYMEEHGLHNDSINIIHYGGSPMSWELLERCGKVFSCGFNQGYGMTETYGTVVSLGPDDHHDRKHLSSVGRPAHGNELRIIGDDGQTLGTGEIGEICIKTPAVMTCYIGMPERTAEVLRDGWYYTGDIGYLDEDGYLFLTGRKNDMIITGGENVYPQEVESCILMLQDDISDVCVTGIHDAVWGEMIAAIIVRKPGSDISEAAIMAHCSEQLGRYKCPKRILFMDSIPVNDMGKVSRAAARKLFEA